MTPLVAVVVTIGMIFVVPIGLRLIPRMDRRAAMAWPYAAAPAAVALWLPRSALAAALCLPYAIVAALLALSASVRVGRVLASAYHSGLTNDAERYAPEQQHRPARTASARARLVHAGAYHSGLTNDADRYAPEQQHRPGWTSEIAIATALMSPLVAASALVAERDGFRLFGFTLPVLALTVAHFHFAGFSAALVAGLVSKHGNRYAAMSVPVGIGCVFAGFFLGPDLQLAGAAVLTSGMWVVAWLLWHETASDRSTRLLLRTSALVLPATMLLALDWALGHVVDVPHLPLVWMEATHGVCNAIGFALCAVLALRRLTSGSN